MASFLDRVRYANDWETDGGEVEAVTVAAMIGMYAAGVCSAGDIKTHFGCTTAQGTQLDAILAARPIAPLLLLNVPAYVQWADKVEGVLRCAQYGIPPVHTDAATKTALGI